MPEFTQTETAILKVLSDGMPHRKEEILAALPDPKYTSWSTVRVHVFKIRAKLNKIGQTIVCVRGFGRLHQYQHVRLLLPDHIA